MNKQQLAQRIWAAANKMRSKIEANEYKDYILGFIFYKYLSEQELRFLYANGLTDEELPTITENEEDVVKTIQDNLGYFIGYDNLYSTWLAMGKDFDVGNVRDALSAFSRLISPSHKKVFDKIFDTLQTGLSKLGTTAGEQTKAIIGLLELIKDIPMNGKQDYDVLGFIYEYLIGQFAANAGKKAGEFYTPHEVSVLMSEIIAHHTRGKNEIQIYDPTSGSGSLLINIGESVAKYMPDSDHIKYYAQELKANTFNLTRMNLVMRGIKPDNIMVRNGDTLADDWPYFDDSDPANTYDPLYVDAVVSNPPYSQQWEPENKENDPRYANFGLAPASKADYAFLLHDLYHLKPDGIMTIVLPHGVLFRGGEEGEIRKHLIENNNIDAIIGLPANIFFGTGIPTIIMVLKQKRTNTDVLIIDASKGFIKDGKNNRLRASDIKRIADTVTGRKDVPKYARKVSLEEIRKNEYNLNIPRYVDSSDKEESWDIYATMYGGIPKAEINELASYWEAFPGLKDALYVENDSPYTTLSVNDVKQTVEEHESVQAFKNQFHRRFADFKDYLHQYLIVGMDKLSLGKAENEIGEALSQRMEGLPLLDSYEAYQMLDDKWGGIAGDLEMIQTDGFDSVRVVDPHMVTKTKDKKEVEVQDGWVGRIIPMELVQTTLLKADYTGWREKADRFNEIQERYKELIEELPEEEKEGEQSLTNDENDAFVAKAVDARVKRILETLDTEETKALGEYAKLSKKNDKLAFIASHPEIHWDRMECGKNGMYSLSVVKKYCQQCKAEIPMPEGSVEAQILEVQKMLSEEKELKKEIKDEEGQLESKTKETIEHLTDEEAKELLVLKWIHPLSSELGKLPDQKVDELVGKINAMAKKYETTLMDTEKEIHETEKELAGMLDDLEGNEFDMKGLREFKAILLGD